MSNNPLHDELAYIRSMAEQGSIGPTRNAGVLVTAGIVYAIAAVAQYLVAVGVLPRVGWISAVIWGGATLAFAVISLTVSRRASGPRPVGARAASAAWAAVGIGIGAFILSLTVIGNVLHDFATVSFLIAPVILILYGIGWWVGAAITGTAWTRWVALGCFVAAPLITGLAGHAEQMLAYAVCLFLFTTLPGLIVLRQEKA